VPERDTNGKEAAFHGAPHEIFQTFLFTQNQGEYVHSPGRDSYVFVVIYPCGGAHGKKRRCG